MPAGQAVTAQQQVTQVQQVQTAQGGQQQQTTQAPTRLVLGQLPGGKLVLQGSQLAALTQARAAGQAGGQPKVLTIQLQVQQQPNQQGGVKVRKKCFKSLELPVCFVLNQISVLFHLISFSSSVVCEKLLGALTFSFVIKCCVLLRNHAMCQLFSIDASERALNVTDINRSKSFSQHTQY